ncbi:TPA: transcriptional regulator [Clostridium perfringens]|nr:transcriptional regulator [Clostridium perfringens]HAT4269956.1 transcriptional regulator [Clostridium perfringens]
MKFEVNFEDQYNEFLANISNMYYNENKTQSEIAKEFNTTRFKVAKYLQEARDKNIVNIEINHPEIRLSTLEKKFKEQFGLKEAIILKVNNNDASEYAQTLGKTAADYIQTILNEDSIVGLTWGKTLYHAIKNIKASKKLPITVVQPFGTSGKGNISVDTPSLIHLLSDKYDSNYRLLYAPLYIMDDMVRKNLSMELVINQSLLKAKEMDILLTGLGTPEAIYSTLLWKESFLQDEFIKHQAVGAIYGRLYDKEGNFLDTSLNNKVFGIDSDTIKAIENKVCIVTGKFKSVAILGALKGKLINTLITDELTATKVLHLSSIE